MFKSIHKLALTCASLSIIANVQADGMLNLTFIPKAKADTDPALAKPFTLTGTPEELEEGFDKAMEQVVGGRQTLEEQALATAEILKMAAAESATKGTNALKGKTARPAPSKPGSTVTVSQSSGDVGNDGDNDDDELPRSEATAATAAATSARPAPVVGMNLFAD